MNIRHTETAYFAGGCFWCITPTFKEMEGVIDVTSGYSGGEEVNPTYADVKMQKTRHRETIRISFDPVKVTFEELLDIFLLAPAFLQVFHFATFQLQALLLSKVH